MSGRITTIIPGVDIPQRVQTGRLNFIGSDRRLTNRGDVVAETASHNSPAALFTLYVFVHL